MDSLQALLLSVYKAQSELEARVRFASVRLDWLGPPDLGFTVEPDQMV
ncbi:hypothetical protein GCM10010156_77560 [Planobispora rosea]|uniref:Uncharacterized protein n=1 Tax=Planobispora rosea TaxID=35762 RepID=A0A8J3SA43_PLARO|nr:hypothetical protein [Planobispora rosea]GGT09205.1 hypothetical protein GCM10010156_77560 [Planobispora rosea]GIH88840.1 hypothetical protein Pro02_72480 [Planobispora rosea]